MHINVRELLAAERVLQALEPLVTNKSIMVLSDNSVAVSYLARMTGRVVELALLARRILHWATKRAVSVTAMHIPGENNTLADRLSRMHNQDWTTSTKLFRTLQDRYHHEVDWFAEDHNSKLQVFASRFRSNQASYTNALATSWSNRNGFMAPPFAILPQVVQKIIDDQVQATLIAPVWPNQPWYQKLLQVTEEMVLIPNTSVFFQPGLSCQVPEPLRNLSWRMAAFRVHAKESWRPKDTPVKQLHFAQILA